MIQKKRPYIHDSICLLPTLFQKRPGKQLDKKEDESCSYTKIHPHFFVAIFMMNFISPITQGFDDIKSSLQLNPSSHERALVHP